MATDIIVLARRRREELVAELARIDAFLEVAAELSRNEGDSPVRGAPRLRPAIAQRGVGADTVAAGLAIVRMHGPLTTRSLLPLIKERGIPVGGKSDIATLSARLSSTGKGVLEIFEGKWHAVQPNEAPGSETPPEREESADETVRGQSADSLFHQTKEGRYAATLA
jgi:hypothetical protein